MEFRQTPLPGVIEMIPDVHGDKRGFFLEYYHQEKFSGAGIKCSFVQDNHSGSQYHVLRGLHYQLKYPQGKLVRVIRGAVFDVAADIRRGSPTFGKWYGRILSEQNKISLFLPPGFAHGFCVLTDEAEFTYKCTDFYHPGDEHGIIWNDAALSITWPVKEPILSSKDADLPTLDLAVLPEYHPEENQ